MSLIRIIGVGSPFGDDRLGWAVIACLEQNTRLRPFIPEQLQLIVSDRPGLLLLEIMRGANTVILIDAMSIGAKPGSIHHVCKEDLTFLDHVSSSHGVGIAEAIKMGEILHDLPNNLYLYGIEINEIGMQFELSSAIKKAVNTLSKQIENFIFIDLKKNNCKL